MILDPVQTNRALLTWQRPLGGPGPRDRIAVAELVQDHESVRFFYLHNGLVVAREQGFVSYPGIPLSTQPGDRNAMHVLLRRLPPRARGDFGEYLSSYGIAPDVALTDLSLLAYTGARVASDSDGFGVAETFDGFDRPFRCVFDVSGYRHYRNTVPELSLGDEVRLVAEPDNQQDPNAIKFASVLGVTLGYVNRTQVPAVHRWLRGGNVRANVFRINGRAGYPRLFVMADVDPGSSQVEAA